MALDLNYGIPNAPLSSALGSYGVSQTPFSFGQGPAAYNPAVPFMPPTFGSPVAPVPMAPAAPMMQTMGATPDTRAAEVQGQTAPADFSVGGFAKGLLWQDGKLNLGGLKTAADIAGALGSLWGGFQQNKMAKEMMSTQREAFRTNLSNQIDTYNTSLSDRAYARYSQEGRSSADADAYIAKNKLGG